VDWMHFAQGRDQWREIVNTVMNLRISWKAGNFLASWVTSSFSGRTLFHGVSQSVSHGSSTQQQVSWNSSLFTCQEAKRGEFQCVMLLIVGSLRLIWQAYIFEYFHRARYTSCDLSTGGELQNENKDEWWAEEQGNVEINCRNSDRLCECLVRRLFNDAVSYDVI
jgi:hypothetical protein